eukprot:TRINITY_DN83428_c0_g1_i1.p2 TRINITY_DN83428_c0_g1~~TRINITY_DN83428_c0_g1_i1.p2  ORF type:complete len:109 (-),score=10.71 TRINITY_DN83428_c0_g1_i1:44-370(-)
MMFVQPRVLAAPLSELDKRQDQHNRNVGCSVSERKPDKAAQLLPNYRIARSMGECKSLDQDLSNSDILQCIRCLLEKGPMTDTARSPGKVKLPRICTRTAIHKLLRKR